MKYVSIQYIKSVSEIHLEYFHLISKVHVRTRWLNLMGEFRYQKVLKEMYNGGYDATLGEKSKPGTVLPLILI